MVERSGGLLRCLMPSVYPTDMLTGGILTWFGMFGAENASCDLSMRRCCRKTFDLASGGLLTCLISVSLHMFDRSYPDMFWHVWACAVAVAITFDLASGGLLTCLISVSSYMFDRSYPDMFSHVWACAVAAVFTYVWQVFSWWVADKTWQAFCK